MSPIRPTVRLALVLAMLAGLTLCAATQAAAEELGPIPTELPVSRCAPVSFSPHVVKVGETISGSAGPATDACGGPASTVSWSWGVAGEPALRVVSGCTETSAACVMRAVGPTGSPGHRYRAGCILGSSDFGGWDSCDYFAVEGSGSTKISGKVLTPFGDGDSGVTVSLSGSSSAQTTTGSDGSYSFTVEPGTYAVTPVQSGGGSGEFDTESCQGRAGPSSCSGMTLSSGQSAEANFSAGFEISGRVLGADAKPLAGVTVALQDEEQGTLHQSTGTTNSTGEFQSRLAPGAVTVTAHSLAGVEFFPDASPDCQPSNASCAVKLDEDRRVEFSACVVPNPNGEALPANTPSPIPGAITAGQLEAVGCWSPQNAAGGGQATVYTSEKPVRLDGIDVKPAQGTVLRLDTAGPTVSSSGAAQLMVGGWAVTKPIQISLNYQGGSTVSVSDQGAGTGPLAPNLFGLPISLGTGGALGYGLPFSESPGQTTITGGLQLPVNTHATWDPVGGVFQSSSSSATVTGEGLIGETNASVPSVGLSGAITATNRVGLTGSVCGSINDLSTKRLLPFLPDAYNDGEISGLQLCYGFEKGIWEGSGMFQLPTALARFAGDVYVKVAAQKAQPADSGQFLGYKLQKFGLQFDHLNSQTYAKYPELTQIGESGIPIGLGFFLQSLGGEFSNDLTTGNVSSITGTLGISFGPEVSVKLGESSHGTELSLLRGDLAFNLLPAAQGLEYWTYQLAGSLTFGRLSPAELQLAAAKVTYHANPVSPEADFYAQLGGSLLGTGLTMSVSGQSDVPNGFLLEGTLTGKTFGQVGTLDAILDNYLLGVCLTANGAPVLGFSEDLSKLDVLATPGCNLGAFKHPNGAAASAVRRVQTLRVRRGLKATMLAVQGSGAAPAVTLAGGGRTLAITPSTQPRNEHGALVFANGRTTYIGLVRPRAGRWTVRAGSGAIAQVLQANPQPSARVEAKTVAHGCSDVVRYRLKPVRGERELIYAQQGSEHVYVGAPHGRSGALSMKMLPAVSGRGKLTVFYLHGKQPVATASLGSFADAASNGSERPTRLTRKAKLLRWHPACAASAYVVALTSAGKTTTQTTRVPHVELAGARGSVSVLVTALDASGAKLGSLRRTLRG